MNYLLTYFNQSINQSINLYRAIVQRRVLQCGYAESKRNVLRRILNMLTDTSILSYLLTFKTFFLKCKNCEIYLFVQHCSSFDNCITSVRFF